MSARLWRAAVLAGVSHICPPAFAQDVLPDLVITANKQPQSIQEIGSSVTVITQEEIQKQGSKSVRDILDGQPGLNVAETGGPGGFVSLYMRGTDSRHTLVLIDGVRANDASTTGGETDLSLVSPQNIERIEIVRGPQSALYGSDAIGGVINIITKKGKQGPPVWQLRTEGGSYGSYGSKLSVSGATQDVNYAFGLHQYHTDGFQRYGYRIPRLAYLNPNGTDPFNRYGGSGRVSWRVNDWLTLETGFNVTRSDVQYDSGFAPNPLAPNQQEGRLMTLFQRAIAENGPFRTTLTTFQSRTERDYKTLDPSTSKYVGERVGAEAQEDVSLERYGKLTFGARFEQEKAKTDSIAPWGATNTSDTQSTKSVYALYQIALFDRLHLSAGARRDHVTTFGTFDTFRLTAAYDLTATTRLHASYGTGAKAPSLYQLNAPFYGNPNLRPETSRGFDIGVDQTFLDGDARVGVTYFNNRLRNLITGDAPAYVYYNVARAATSGFEVSGDYNIAPTFAKLKIAYTRLETEDLSTGLALFRRPKNSARISVVFTPAPDLTIEPIVRLVGDRFDSNFPGRVKLPGYVRYDVVADYKLNANVSVFARGENLTNAKYEDVYNYGTPGRSVYGGMQVTW